MATLGPRLVVSGIGSGVGKTTVATGLMAAFAARGLEVASAKVGPDFIDPGYHSVATGRPGRTLDAWLSGDDLLAPLAASAGQGVDLLVVEGVMGMFDGSGQPGCDGSTAAVARLLDAPVMLVIDVWTMSGTVAAVVHGLRTFDPEVNVAGVILNRIAGEGHATLCREALEPLGLPVLGAIRHDDGLTWRERHLGLVPVAEHRTEVRLAVERIGAVIAASCDMGRIIDIARSASNTIVPELPAAAPSGSARIALASGPAFSFVYPENLELLEQAGGELVPFDPLRDRALPDGCQALYAGGGFPEEFGAALAENRPLLSSVRRAIEAKLTTWAECGGLLWLSRSLDGSEMVGAIPGDARMTEDLSIGYRTATTRVATPFGEPGSVLRGYEFHRTTLDPPGDALLLEARFGSEQAGYASPTLFASYLHQHLSASPGFAERFVAASSMKS
jgi:cobyrinic acid a,c-diamide synthase